MIGLAGGRHLRDRLATLDPIRSEAPDTSLYAEGGIGPRRCLPPASERMMSVQKKRSGKKESSLSGQFVFRARRGRVKTI